MCKCFGSYIDQINEMGCFSGFFLGSYTLLQKLKWHKEYHLNKGLVVIKNTFNQFVTMFYVKL